MEKDEFNCVWEEAKAEGFDIPEFQEDDFMNSVEGQGVTPPKMVEILDFYFSWLKRQMMIKFIEERDTVNSQVEMVDF